MFKLCIILIFTSLQAVSGQNLSLEANISDPLLNELYSELDYSVGSPLKYEVNAPFKVNNSLSGKIKNIEFDIPAKFISFIERPADKLVNFHWKTDNFKTKTILDVKITYKRNGIVFTHNDTFSAESTGLNNSVTQTYLSGDQNSINFKVVKNVGFNIDKLEVKPVNGTSSVLKWILNNVVSLDEITNTLKLVINEQLTGWRNKELIITSIEEKVNDQLSKARNIKINIAELANHFKLNLVNFSMKKASIGFDFKTKHPSISMHPCVQIKSNKNVMTLGKDFIENVVNHYLLSAEFKEPLLCFGYDKYVQGLPVGKDVSLSVLGKDINLKLWLAPSEVPKYSYQVEEQTFKVSFKLKTLLKSIGYPHLYFSKEEFDLDLDLTYKIELLQDGLYLVFNKLELPNIPTSIKVKWNKITPKLPISNNRVSSMLRNFIRKQLSKEVGPIKLVSKKINFISGTHLEILKYNLNELNHNIEFEIMKNDE